MMRFPIATVLFVLPDILGESRRLEIATVPAALVIRVPKRKPVMDMSIARGDGARHNVSENDNPRGACGILQFKKGSR
jgi:hypothetical protein